MKSILQLLRWLESFVAKPDGLVVVHVASMNDVPQKLGNYLFVVGDADQPKWVVLACPCRHHERIDVNLMGSRSPSWSLQQNEDCLTLLPSLWMPKEGCGSHFWIVRNRVVWARGRRAIVGPIETQL